MSECRGCGDHVTEQFARVFGDNDDIAHACPNCPDTHNTDIFRGEGAGK